MLPSVPPTKGSEASPQANAFLSFHSSTSSVTDTGGFAALCHHLLHARTQWLSEWQTRRRFNRHSSKHVRKHTFLSTWLTSMAISSRIPRGKPSRRRKNSFPKLARPEHGEINQLKKRGLGREMNTTNLWRVHKSEVHKGGMCQPRCHLDIFCWTATAANASFNVSFFCASFLLISYTQTSLQLRANCEPCSRLQTVVELRGNKSTWSFIIGGCVRGYRSESHVLLSSSLKTWLPLLWNTDSLGSCCEFSYYCQGCAQLQKWIYTYIFNIWIQMALF